MDLKKMNPMLADMGIDALIASSHQNVFYSSGFPYIASAHNSIFYLLRNIGPVFTIIPKDEEPILISPNSGRATSDRFCHLNKQHFYIVSAPSELETATQSRKSTFTALEALKENLTKLRITKGRIGIEGLDLPMNIYLGLKELLPDLEFVDAQDLFFRMRAIKSPDEVEKLRNASLLACKGLEAAFENIHEGSDEIDILNIYKTEVVRIGGSWCNTKFCAGAVNGATISHQPSDYKILPKDPAIFDVGAIYQGYCSDIARVGYLHEAAEKGLKLYEVLSQAQEKAIEAMKPGAKISEVFDAGVNHVKESGYPEYKRGNIGHGVGIDFEEEPFLSSTSAETIQPGMTLAVEIPFYDKQIGGFNVEDNVYITETGPEIMTDSLSKDVRILK
jgi:Xaa-Pro dipeptidase